FYGSTASGADLGADATPSKYNRGYKYTGASSITVPANNGGIVYRYFKWIAPTFTVHPQNNATDWSVCVTLRAEVSNATKTRWQRAHADENGNCAEDWEGIPGTEEEWNFPDEGNTTSYTTTPEDATNKWVYYRVMAVGDVDE
ncbi:MAG: hypothetical protein K5770_06240, partial [Lachnospiraceae bacterium]|nr:hypothetical protein [Lachnospiraceae bacterium]